MKTLIIGRTGQLARALLRSVPPSFDVVSTDRTELDLTDTAAVVHCIERSAAQVVINASAYTAVDLAETEPDIAFAINSRAVAAMAHACRSRGSRLVHVSTDFVFDGCSGRPYRPSDATNPLNVYGQSKLAGEQSIAAIPDLDWRIIRTAWVYSATGRNFVLTMLRLFRERDHVGVVADQIGTPTNAASLASCVWKTASDSSHSSVLHFTDAGVASWFDFAWAIYEEASALGLPLKTAAIEAITTDQFPTAARRPSFSVLDKAETWKRLGIAPVHWRVKLRETLRELTA